jgi:lysophospholipid acyltransferase (LPLAT)-like uncharacterized protein
MLPQTFAGLLIGFIYKAWSSTFRYHVSFENEADRKLVFEDLFSHRPHPGKNLIYACFHQDDMSCIPYFRDHNIGVLVSASKDGRMLATALEHFGYQTVKGSSHRRAVAGLLASIRLVQEGHNFTIAVDGPRGPLFEVKEGITHLSQKTGRPIVPVKAHPRCAFIFKKSWSRTALPLPFSRVDISMGTIGYYDATDLEAKMRSLAANT